MTDVTRLEVVEERSMVLTVEDIGDDQLFGDIRIRIATDIMVVSIVMKASGSATREEMLSDIDTNTVIGSMSIANVDELEDFSLSNGTCRRDMDRCIVNCNFGMRTSATVVVNDDQIFLNVGIRVAKYMVMITVIRKGF